MPGKWTAQIVWADGRGHVQTPPNVPGSYSGTVTFQTGGQNFATHPASGHVTISPHSAASVPLAITLPREPGDAPESVQFTGPGGLETSVPVARRTLIPSRGGAFRASLTSSVSRGPGRIKTFYVNVPAGERDLDVPGLWEIDVMQGATTDGTEFSQTVTGAVAYNRIAPVTQTGLPASASATIGSAVPVAVTVRNTTNHVGFFELRPSGGDITGGNTVTPLELAPGTAGTLTATLSPTAAAGSAVTGTLSVIDSTDWGAREPAIGFPASYSDFHDFAYAYTAGG